MIYCISRCCKILDNLFKTSPLPRVIIPFTFSATKIFGLLCIKQRIKCKYKKFLLSSTSLGPASEKPGQGKPPNTISALGNSFIFLISLCPYIYIYPHSVHRFLLPHQIYRLHNRINTLLLMFSSKPFISKCSSHNFFTHNGF